MVLYNQWCLWLDGHWQMSSVIVRLCSIEWSVMIVFWSVIISLRSVMIIALESVITAFPSVLTLHIQQKLTSWCVLSVLLHSSFRFSSSLSLCLCSPRRDTEAPVVSAPGLRPPPSPRPVPGKPRRPASPLPGASPLLYSAHRLRMVSSLCRSWDTQWAAIRYQTITARCKGKPWESVTDGSQTDFNKNKSDFNRKRAEISWDIRARKSGMACPILKVSGATNGISGLDADKTK